MSISATTAATGYPAINMLSPRIARAWRSTSTAQQQIVVDLGADVAVASVWIQSCNAAGCTVEKKLAVGSYVSVGTLTIYQEPTGRRKGWLAVPGTYRYLRLTIAAGTPVDGAAYWEAGAIYVFSSMLQLPKSPQWGVSISTTYPQITQVMPNGRTITANAGQPCSRIFLEFASEPAQDVAVLLREARHSTVGFSLGDTERPWDAWPVVVVSATAQRKLVRHKSDSQAFDLREQI